MCILKGFLICEICNFGLNFCSLALNACIIRMANAFLGLFSFSVFRFVDTHRERQLQTFKDNDFIIVNEDQMQR